MNTDSIILKDKENNLDEKLSDKPARKLTRISNVSKKELTSPLPNKKVSKERFNELRKRLMLLLKDEKFFLIGGSISASCNGAIWPIYGILLADAIGTLSEPVMDEVSQGGLNIAMMFLALAFIAAIILWMQKYNILN